ncbi:glycosyltransferase family 2 protein [Fulvivirga sp. 29W222]|uniref:Glycosyltransferase family 2 protein n=1 Tax=Fulvivirga marina TaxID=2494733 RepID=A0A937G339_9BACT|nr:glycosyltransferase family 2 protein [Fulvivirga marina]MBL6449802.1 glycosyltransferase family 2 protein [Fulvivirga marina]
MMPDEVSVIIPTRNRRKSLMQLLEDLSKQTYALKEVIIVDSSDERMNADLFDEEFPSLNVKYLASEASVCIQRNLGIKEAQGSHIFLCDDDINLPEDYVAVLMEHSKTHQSGATSGLVMQKESGDWEYSYPPASFGKLLFAFIFQQSVWGDISNMQVKVWQRPFYRIIKQYYRYKGNSLSLAGWPVITEFKSPAFHVAVYGLGASIIKREWLINSLYDEVLDPHGIGDNYGVAIGFPAEKAVEVVCAAKAYHHQSKENRLESATTYYRRLVALDYFLKKFSRFNWWHKLWFAWSLLGNLLLFRNKEEYRDATKRVLKLALWDRNPYQKASRQGEKVLELKLDH